MINAEKNLAQKEIFSVIKEGPACRISKRYYQNSKTSIGESNGNDATDADMPAADNRDDPLNDATFVVNDVRVPIDDATFVIT